LSNSKCRSCVEARKRGAGVSLVSVRGTTQTTVKVPKYRLSVNGKKVFTAKDSEEVGLEAATL
jgi:hypothetical protein